VQVNVIPLVGTNTPPATTGDAAVFLILNTVGDTSIVTVKLLLNASSAAVGNVPVFQTVVSDQFPFFTA
jgi:hypothetical protein